MSADNWTECPRCVAALDAAVAVAEEALLAADDANDLAAWKEAHSLVTVARHNRAQVKPTFREDYEFYGAEEGEVTASYSGECQACGLAVNFREQRRFFDPSSPEQSDDRSAR
jgi:hypothetical protein